MWHLLIFKLSTVLTSLIFTKCQELKRDLKNPEELGGECTSVRVV